MAQSRHPECRTHLGDVQVQPHGEEAVAGPCGTVWTGLLALMAQYLWTLGLFSGPPCCHLPPLCVLELCGPSRVGVGAGRHYRHHLACSSEAFIPRCWASLLFSVVCKQLRLGRGHTPTEGAMYEEGGSNSLS